MSHIDETPLQEVNTGCLSISNAFLPKQYTLDLNVTPTKPMFTGDIAIDMRKNDRFVANGKQQNTITLHSSKLVITKAVIGDQKLKILYNKSEETVTFTSESNLPDSFVLNLTYVGQINSVKTFNDPTFGLFKTNYLDNISGNASNLIFATHNQPFFTKKVFPLIDEISFKAPIKLSVTTLNKFKVISNAQLASKEMISMSEDAKFSFELTPPMPGHLFALVFGDLEYIEVEVEKKLPMRFYTPIGESQNANYPLQVAQKVIPELSKIFNQEFPLTKIDFAALPFLSDHVMENWGLITFNQHQILHSEYDESILQQTKRVVAHELVHQWVGNLVSFDDWKYMWLNESFATWMGNLVLSKIKMDPQDSSESYHLENIMETEDLMQAEDELIDSDSPISINKFMSSISCKASTEITTHEFFNKEIYEKGIKLLKMIHGVLGEENCFKAIQSFIDKYKYTSVKATELWSEFISASGNGGVLSFIHSWLSYEGYPVVSVELQDAKDIIVKQTGSHTYHLPLNLKSKDGSIVQSIFSKDENELLIEPQDLVCINSGRLGYYRVKYSPQLFDRIELSVSGNLFSSADLATILTDYKYFIENCELQLEVENALVLIMKILNGFVSKSWNIDFNVLRLGLSLLEFINSILITRTEYTAFSKWLEDYVTKLFMKIGNWDKDIKQNYDVDEMIARNSILSLGLQKPEFQKIAKKLFKDITLGRSFVPKELIPSMFNLYISSASQKEYKQVLALSKNSDVSALNYTNCPQSFFQTCAVESLAFTHNDDLLNKTLNFAMTNIDSKLIELCLVGFQFNTDKHVRNKLFDWYLVHYKQWTLRSHLKSQWSAQLKMTLKNITQMVIELVPSRREELIKKASEVANNGLLEILNEYDLNSKHKERISKAYPELINSITCK